MARGKAKEPDANDDVEQTASKSGGIGVEDLNLPRTLVQRLAKGVLPPNTQIQKDALLAMSKSGTVFVSYLASHANENARAANKKTVQPQDVLDALKELEFDEFLPRLQEELKKYNSIQSDKRNSYRKKVRDEKRATAVDGDEAPPSSPTAQLKAEADGAHANGTARGDEPPAAKRAKRLPGDESDGIADEDDPDLTEPEDIEDEPEVEDDEAEDEEDEDEEGDPHDTGLAEDPLEEAEQRDDPDEALDGDPDDD